MEQKKKDFLGPEKKKLQAVKHHSPGQTLYNYYSDKWLLFCLVMLFHFSTSFSYFVFLISAVG